MDDRADLGTVKSKSRRRLVIASVTVMALVLAGAGAWGVMTVRDNRLIEEAQGHLAAVRAEEQQAHTALAAHLELIDAGQAWLPDLETSEEMLQSRPELFDGEVQAAFTDALAVLTEATASPAAAQVRVDPLFDPASGTFVEQYRSARADQREELARASEEAVGELRELARSLQAADAEIDEAMGGAETAVQALLADLPAQAETITADYPEAEEDAVLTLQAAASGEQAGGASDGEAQAEEAVDGESAGEESDGEAVDGEAGDGEDVTTASGPAGGDGTDLDPAAMAEQIAALPELLIVYIESADGVRDSHEHMVAEREAEEERARIAAEEARAAEQRAQQSAPQGGGSGSSGGGVCTRYVSNWFGGGSLILVPCP